MTQDVAHVYENPDLRRVEDSVETLRQATGQLAPNIEVSFKIRMISLDILWKVLHLTWYNPLTGKPTF